MALSKSTLSTLLQSKLTAAITIADAAQLVKVCDAIADAVVTHITGAAVVTASGPDPQGSTQTVTGTIS